MNSKYSSLIETLSKPINATDIKYNPEFLDRVHKLAKHKYSCYNDDSRTYEDVFYSFFIGELGEQAIYSTCKDNHDVVMNDEQFTQQYYWDIAIDGNLCEVKFKNKNDSYNFSFDNKSKDNYLFSHWKYYQLIISFYIKEIGNEIFVVPWLLIDSKSINQELLYKDGKPFYRDSAINDGRLLKKEAEDYGLFVRLNVPQNAFKLTNNSLV